MEYGKSQYASESAAVVALELATSIKKKEILDEMKKLQDQHFQAKEGVGIIIKTAEDAQKRVEDLQKEIIFLENAITERTKETKEFLSFCIKTMQDCRVETDKAIEVLGEVNKCIEEGEKTLKTAQDETKTLHLAVIAEGKIMDRQRNDLDIYHDRLQEYFKKYLPEQRITL